MDSLKVFDPEGPIREADVVRPPRHVRFVPIGDIRIGMKEAANLRRPLPRNIEITLFSGWVLLYARPGKAAVHLLVEGFSVFGVQVQYWMLIAALIVVVAVMFAMRGRGPN
jgi:hypothetical protein